MVAIFNGGGCDGSQILVSLRDLTMMFFKKKTRPAFVQNKANKFFLYLLFNCLFTIQHALYYKFAMQFIALQNMNACNGNQELILCNAKYQCSLFSN